MARFVIEGRRPLKGVVTPSGNKNTVVALLAACLLTDQEIVLDSVPRIRDVQTMLHLLTDLGVQISERGEHTLALRAADVRTCALDADLCKDIRASILLAGPMLGRCKAVTLPPPGGDVIGRRRVDTHFMALRALGATIEADGGYDMRVEELRGADIFLDEMSVTATENALMAATLAKGTTVIRNAASEPHVQDLANFLNQLGARISGVGTNTLTVEGVERLRGGAFRIPSDHIEVGSFIGLAAAAGGEITVRDAVPEHLHMTRLMFNRLGVAMHVRGRDVVVPAGQHLRVQSDIGEAIPKIDDAPWPGFPADLMSIAVVVATQAEGTILIHEKMYESRLFFVDKLIAMGARIVLCDPHRAVIVGPSRLHAEPGGMASPDIRAGMALLIAALCAEGKSVIRNIEQIDRGYEKIEERLQALGAKIERVMD